MSGINKVNSKIPLPKPHVLPSGQNTSGKTTPTKPNQSNSVDSDHLSDRSSYDMYSMDVMPTVDDSTFSPSSSVEYSPPIRKIIDNNDNNDNNSNNNNTDDDSPTKQQLGTPKSNRSTISLIPVRKNSSHSPKSQRSSLGGNITSTNTNYSNEKDHILELETLVKDLSERIDVMRIEYENQQNELNEWKEKCGGLESQNQEFEDLLSQSNTAMIDLTSQIETERIERDGLVEENTTQKQMIESLKEQIVQLKSRKTTESIIESTTNNTTLTKESTSDEIRDSGDSKMRIKNSLSAIYDGQTIVASSIRSITENLCDYLLTLETALEDEGLQQLLKKSEVKEDPYSSTRGWQQQKKKKKRGGTSLLGKDDFAFGKPSDRLLMIPHDEGEHEQEDDFDEGGNDNDNDDDNNNDNHNDNYNEGIEETDTEEIEEEVGSETIDDRNNTGTAHTTEREDGVYESYEEYEDDEQPKYISPSKFRERFDEDSADDVRFDTTTKPVIEKNQNSQNDDDDADDAVTSSTATPSSSTQSSSTAEGSVSFQTIILEESFDFEN